MNKPIAAASRLPWPGFMSALEHETSESRIAAVGQPDAKVHAPPASLAKHKARWSGVWSGWAGQGRSIDIRLAVEKLDFDGAVVCCARASLATGPFHERAIATFNGDELEAVLDDGARLRLRMRNAHTVEMIWSETNGSWVADVLSNRPVIGRRINERISTGMIEDGCEITLEMVSFKPPGSGPFPLLVFHHGSTGMGNDPALFASTVTSPALADFFNERGWMVAFPQRRGRGKSDGRYDEGLELDRSRYSDRPEHALLGVDRALCDLDAVMAHVAQRNDADLARAIIGGHSRGGALSIAFAGTRAQRLLGVINFVGGWIDGTSKFADEINGSIFRRGAAGSAPTLWLYADQDPFYGLEHSRKNFDAFKAAGGRGEFHIIEMQDGEDGHHIHSRPELWETVMDEFLAAI